MSDLGGRYRSDGYDGQTPRNLASRTSLTRPASPLRALRALAADLLPIAVLIDELKHEDSQSRLRSVQRLGDIAEALGAIRTREELIPFLSNDMDDDDEVLREFASQLGSLLDAVGGAPAKGKKKKK